MEEGSETGVWARGFGLVFQSSYDVPPAYARPVLSKDSALGRKFLDLSGLKQGKNKQKNSFYLKSGYLTDTKFHKPFH